MEEVRAGRAHEEGLRRLRRSPLVADAIPLPLRLLDLSLVLLLLPAALLVGVVVSLAIVIDSPGPVIYRSRRIGRSGLPFEMLKFRTMVRDADGPLLSAHGDERYTPLGRTLAYSRLDELPQLWNVLRGEMRLVGPRPELEDFVREFPAEYERILGVPPGLTGPAQVAYAWEGETLARAQSIDRARLYRDEILPYKVAIDLDYAERHGVRSDLALLARTLLLPALRLFRKVTGTLLAPAGRPQPLRVAAALTLALSILVLVGLLAAEAAAPV
jgi:lipopolysaccharide/colanic/teichoic acid biosynthesis glycosyltransferase